jgi:DNA-binding transcriptional LysR family regulator
LAELPFPWFGAEKGVSYNQEIIQFCRQFGKFRPRFVAIGKTASLAGALVTAANEDAIVLKPSFISYLDIPNVILVPIADKEATWDVFVVWQRGKIAGHLRALLDTLLAD